MLAIVPGGNCAPKSLISRPVFGSHEATISVMALRIPVVVSFTFSRWRLARRRRPRRPPSAGDAKRGQTLAYTCNGCHAIPNYKNVYPTYSVPKLHGQRPEYLVAALKAYKSGERSHGTMHSQASLDERAGHGGHRRLSRRPERADRVEERRAGRRQRPKASEVCLACHGTNGVGITADYPTISGQHRDYLERALTTTRRAAARTPSWRAWPRTLTAAGHRAARGLLLAARSRRCEIVPKKSFFFSSN